MILIPGKHTVSGKATLGRCNCSHSWANDGRKYKGIAKFGGKIRMCSLSRKALCPKCGLYPWAIEGLTPAQLSRPEL